MAKVERKKTAENPGLLEGNAPFKLKTSHADDDKRAE